MKKNLTDSFLRNLYSQEEERLQISDSECNGLMARVNASGTKSWIFYFSYHGRTYKKTIGTFPAMSVADARKKVAELKKEGLEKLTPFVGEKKITTEEWEKYIELQKEMEIEPDELARFLRIKKEECHNFFYMQPCNRKKEIIRFLKKAEKNKNLILKLAQYRGKRTVEHVFEDPYQRPEFWKCWQGDRRPDFYLGF